VIFTPASWFAMNAHMHRGNAVQELLKRAHNHYETLNRLREQGRLTNAQQSDSSGSKRIASQNFLTCSAKVFSDR
jgi:hypothetical protein